MSVHTANVMYVRTAFARYNKRKSIDSCMALYHCFSLDVKVLSSFMRMQFCQETIPTNDYLAHTIVIEIIN